LDLSVLRCKFKLLLSDVVGVVRIGLSLVGVLARKLTMWLSVQRNLVKLLNRSVVSLVLGGRNEVLL